MKEKTTNTKRYKFIFLIFILMFASLAVGTSAQEEATAADVLAPEIISQSEEPGVINTTVRVYPDKDTYVASNLPYNNFGGWTDMRSGRDGTYGATRVLIQFNFNSIPSGAIINSARLYLHQNETVPPSDPPYKYGARYLASEWNEYSVTWSSHQPVWGEVFGEAELNNVNGWKSFDARELVESWVSGQHANYGMMIQGSNEASARERVFATRETTLIPYIDVDYTEYVDTCPPSAWFTSVLNQYSPSSFTVSWDGSDCGSNGYPPSGIRNYDVQVSTDNSNWSEWKMDTQDTSGVYSGAHGQKYYFRVRAADNALNIGNWSPSIQTTVDSQPPINRTITIGTIGSSNYVWPHFQVSWSATDDPSGVQKYIVQLNDNAGSGWQGREFPVSQTSEWVSGLDVGKTYSTRLQVVDNVGNASDWLYAPNVIVVSDPSSFVLPFDPAIDNSQDNPNNITVTWAGFSDSPIGEFWVKYRIGDGAWQDMGTYAGNVASAQFDVAALFPSWPNIPATVIGFEVTARNVDQPTYQEQFSGEPEATIIIDPQDTMTNILYMPIIAKN